MKHKSKRKPNPILTLIDLSLKGQRRTAIMDGWHDLSREEQLEITQMVFTRETIYAVGELVLEAVLSGDKQFPKIVQGAIKAGDHLFNRDREILLLRPALRYTVCNWDVLLHKNRGHRQRTVDELKKGIEKHCNRGKQLETHQWSRLRRASGLPKRNFEPRNRKNVEYGTVDGIPILGPPLAKKHRRRTTSTKKPKTVS